MTTKFEDRLLDEIHNDYARLAAPAVPAAPAANVTPIASRNRGIRIGVTVASIAAAVVIGAFAANAIIGTGAAPAPHQAAPVVNAPKITLASVVTAIDAAGPVETVVTGTPEGSTTTVVNSVAGILSTTYKDAAGTVLKQVGFRNGSAGELEAIQVDYSAQTWSTGTFGGDAIADPAKELKDQLSGANGTENGTAKITGTTTLDGVAATTVVLAAPDGSDASTLYLDSSTSLPIKLVGPDGTASTYSWSKDGSGNGASTWPVAPAGFAEVGFDQVDLK